MIWMISQGREISWEEDNGQLQHIGKLLGFLVEHRYEGISIRGVHQCVPQLKESWKVCVTNIAVLWCVCCIAVFCIAVAYCPCWCCHGCWQENTQMKCNGLSSNACPIAGKILLSRKMQMGSSSSSCGVWYTPNSLYLKGFLKLLHQEGKEDLEESDSSTDDNEDFEIEDNSIHLCSSWSTILSKAYRQRQWRST